jgi:branched-chain amino acid transport system permease protein
MREATAWAVVAIIACAAPMLVTANWINVLIQTLFYILLCVSWNVMGGFAGQFSVGHSLFVAIGAYTPAVLQIQFGFSPWLGMVAGVVLAALMGAFIVWLSFRYALPQLSFGLVTLAIAMLGFLLINSLDVLGASRGLALPDTGGAGMFRFSSDAGFYYVALIFAGAAIALTRILYNSRLGLYFRAVRDNERAAMAIGIPLLRTKIIAMAISAGMTAIAGTFLAQYLLIVEPKSFAGLSISVETILFTVVGGIGTVVGPVIGPLLLLPLGEWLRATLGSQVPGLHLLVYGVIVVAVVRLAPGGLVGVARKYGSRSPALPAEKIANSTPAAR